MLISRVLISENECFRDIPSIQKSSPYVFRLVKSRDLSNGNDATFTPGEFQLTWMKRHPSRSRRVNEPE